MHNLQILRKFLLLTGFCLLISAGSAVYAQGFGRGDRGGDGDRDRGSSREGDRGSRFSGGPPGGFGGPPGGFGGSPGGFGGPPAPDQIFSRLDRNQDGRVTEDEVPSFFRDRMQGVDLKRGATQADLTKAFERMRQEREASGGSSFRGGPPQGFTPGSPPSMVGPGGLTPPQSVGGTTPNSTNSRSGSNSGGYFGSSKPRMTVDLPLSYADGDLDGDGQIGFYEWRKWRRNQTETFFTIDTNSDGFLTPTELAAAPTVLAAAARNSANAVPSPTSGSAGTGGPPPGFVPSPAPALTTSPPAVLPNGRRGFPGAPPPVTATTSAPAGSTSGTTVSTAGSEDEQTSRRRAESMFRGLDRDRNGQITEEEWNRSRTLRPQFERAGVDLTRPMSSEVFVETYLKLGNNP